METNVTCLLTEKNRVQPESKKLLSKIYLDKLFRCGLINEEYSGEICVSYNHQQEVIEFRCHIPTQRITIKDLKQYFSDISHSGRALEITDKIKCNRDDHILHLSI